MFLILPRSHFQIQPCTRLHGRPGPLAARVKLSMYGYLQTAMCIFPLLILPMLPQLVRMARHILEFLQLLVVRWLLPSSKLKKLPTPFQKLSSERDRVWGRTAGCEIQNASSEKVHYRCDAHVRMKQYIRQ